MKCVSRTGFRIALVAALFVVIFCVPLVSADTSGDKISTTETTPVPTGTAGTQSPTLLQTIIPTLSAIISPAPTTTIGITPVETTTVTPTETQIASPTLTPTSEIFFIEFDAIGDHFTGDTFFVNGTTNLPAGENLTIEIFHATYLTSPVSGTQLTVLVQPGKNDLNYWSAKISPENWTSYSKHGKNRVPVSGVIPGEFSAQVFSLNHGMTNQSNVFNIFPEGTNWTTGPDSNPPTPTSSFPLILTLVAIVAIAVLTIVKRTGRG